MKLLQNILSTMLCSNTKAHTCDCDFLFFLLNILHTNDKIKYEFFELVIPSITITLILYDFQCTY